MDPKNPVTLRRISADEKGRWDSIVDASPHGTVFHTWDWVSAMAKHSWLRLLGQTIKPIFHPLIAEYEGKDIGLIPLYEFRGRILNYIYSPPPHTEVSYLGPCLTFPEGLKRTRWEVMHRGFHKAVEDYMAALGIQCVRICTSPGYDDLRPYIWGGYIVTPLHNYLLDTKRPLEEILSTKQDYKRRLRKLAEQGFTSRLGSFDDVKKLHHQKQARLEGQGFSMIVTLEYLRDLWESCYPNRMHIIVVEQNGQYISSVLTTSYKGKVIEWMGMQKIASGSISPNELLHWESIKWAVSYGYREYENIGADEVRLNEFKTKLNPGLSRFHYVVRMNRTLSLGYAVKRFVKGNKVFITGL
jgi:hypothetical protein